jgi:hypothetical protein
MTRAYVIVAGNGLTQFDAEGKPRTFKVGDTIQMTDEDAAGQAKFVRLADAAAIAPDPVVGDEDDELL